MHARVCMQFAVYAGGNACTHVYTCDHSYTHIYGCMHARICIRIFIHTYFQACNKITYILVIMHPCTYMHACIFAPMHVCTWSHMQARKYIHATMYGCMDINTHVYASTYACNRVLTGVFSVITYVQAVMHPRTCMRACMHG